MRTGSEADVRLTAYQQRTTPLVQGTVTYVSGDRLVEQQNGAAVLRRAHRRAGRSRSPARQPQAAGRACRPRSSSAPTAARALDYLLAPVTAYLRRAMREPV